MNLSAQAHRLRNLQLYTIAGFLILAGVSLAAYRHFELLIPFQPEETQQIWNVEARVTIGPDPNLPVKAELLIPGPQPNFDILGETIISSGYGQNRFQERSAQSIVWTKRRSQGRDILYYRVNVINRPRRVPDFGTDPAPPPVPDYQDEYRPSIMEFLDSIRQDSADINTYTALLIEHLLNDREGREIRKLLANISQGDSLSDTIVYLLKGARIPSRVVFGFWLDEDGERNEPDTLVQVHDGSNWLTYNPRTGSRTDIRDFLVWSIGTTHPLHTENVIDSGISFSVIRTSLPANYLANERLAESAGLFKWLTLTRLPVDHQKVYEVLLLLPLGAFLIVIFRNLIGMSTAGTFSPVLLALAFRETNLAAGILLSVVVVGFGLTMRLYLERLTLLFVPKISAVLISVILLMTMVTMISNETSFSHGMSVSLFPMVILAWIIERLSIVWEDNGPRDALPQAFFTLIVASICYIILNIDVIQYLCFYFPELILSVLGATLLLGRYSGYRLSELFRFKELRN